MIDITEDDFLAGLLATFTGRGLSAVSIRGDEFYTAIAETFAKLEEISDASGLDVRFYVTLDPVYGDSPVVREAISVAVQRNLISLDNPEYQDMRIKLSPGEAEALLVSLPGGPDLYNKLADVFLASYPFVAV